jgi:cytochrome b
MSPGTARVWDPLIRLLHWSLVFSFGLAWLTSRRSDQIHHWAGYAAAALVLVRLMWGLLGPRYARFDHFVRRPGVVIRYLSEILTGSEARHIGHNPAGGAMVVVLLAGMLATAFTGWMETTDAYFGVRWVETVHSVFAHGLLILVGLHLSGVALASWRHNENLVAAMFTGRKRTPEESDVN